MENPFENTIKLFTRNLLTRHFTYIYKNNSYSVIYVMKKKPAQV